MVNNVIGVVNYVIAARPSLLNFVIADTQVWLFATRFDVPATNNGSENAVRGYKLAAKISGCWRTLSTLQRHCRIRSYLTTARSHGHHPLAAIRDALNGTCWMPPTPA